jgi:DNA-binding FadR family transcriptional regulator
LSPPAAPLRDRRPLPLVLYEALRERIRAGVTVREALRLLQRDGLAAARHGRGHFVLDRAQRIWQEPTIASLDYHRGDRFEFDVVRRRVRG